MNARQRRLFEEARKRNPNLKVPSGPQAPAELTEEDLALIKQGVGDKTPRAQVPPPAEAIAGDQTGEIVKYFEDKGFGFIRPDAGGRDVFFHVSKLTEGQSTDLMPNTRVVFEMGVDKYGKSAAMNLRILPPQ